MKHEEGPCEAHEPGTTISADSYIIYSNTLLVTSTVVRIIVNNELDGMYKETVLTGNNKTVDSSIILKRYCKEMWHAAGGAVG